VCPYSQLAADISRDAHAIWIEPARRKHAMTTE